MPCSAAPASPGRCPTAGPHTPSSPTQPLGCCRRGGPVPPAPHRGPQHHHPSHHPSGIPAPPGEIVPSPLRSPPAPGAPRCGGEAPISERREFSRRASGAPPASPPPRLDPVRPARRDSRGLCDGGGWGARGAVCGGRRGRRRGGPRGGRGGGNMAAPY